MTHDLFEAVKMGDRIALIDAGELIQISTPRLFVENPPSAIADEFLGRHRFQLSLLTKTITECVDLGIGKATLDFPKLTTGTTYFEALNSFKETKSRKLPVFSGQT